jgi:uncharacterized protein YjiS (DUF1127 family)
MNAENLKIEECHPGPQVSSALQRFAATLAHWRERARQRDELAHFDELTLRDLGLVEVDLWRETRKPPWQP